MTIAAAVLGGGLVLGMGIWGMTDRRPAVVPVIEADSRPLRVKPDDPGGMHIAGADDTVLSGKAGGSDRLAPTPEAPAPQALRAQLQPAAPPEPAKAATAPAVATGTVAPAPEAGVRGSPLPDTPPAPQKAAPRPAQAEAAAPEPEPPRTSPQALPTGSMMVQLAAVKSEDAARSEWERLSKRMPGLLGARKPVFQHMETNGRVYWRIRTGGFGSAADAAAFCGKVRAEKNNCAVASF